MALIVDVFQPFSDNFAYLLHDEVSGATASVDAGEAEPVARRAAELGWRLTDVFITHHHSDHTGGVAALKAEFGLTVTGPAGEKADVVGLDRPVAGGDTVMLGETRFEVIDTPGHTLGHICYHAPSEKSLFTGDALFSLGCGRMFEGEPKSMWTGLLALRALPDDTRLYCGHEYTLANARFALSIDPDNRDLLARASEAEAEVLQGRPTIPTTLGSEKKANPFLRADDKALAARMGLENAEPHEVFAAIRRAKDGFRG